MLSEKPSSSITQKAGKIDSGSVIAAMMVARKSRKNRNTTITARMAPSYSVCMRRFVVADACAVTEVSISLRSTSGFAALNAAIAAATASATVTSLAPLARRMLNADHRRAVEARKGARLRNRVGDDAEIVQPHLAAGRQADSRRGEIGEGLGPARVRIAWSRPPISARPPARSTLLPRSWRLTSSGGQADGLQPNRIESDPDFALDASDALDAADAAHALQARGPPHPPRTRRVAPASCRARSPHR